MKHPFRLLSDLIFPPRCASCGKLLAPSVSGEASALCGGCAAAWSRETVSQCPTCFLAYHTCRCSLPHMQRSGIAMHVKMAPYGAENEPTVARGIVLGIKKRVDRRTLRFLARELAPEVRAAIAASEAERLDKGEAPLATVVAHLPRNGLALRRVGFDQARELARALARELGYPALPLLRRVRDTVPQKKLSRRAREINLRGAFALHGSAAGLRVLLVDDVVTTGAGMAEGSRVLNAAEVMAVSVAFTEKKTEK